jgi:hypothetical protein
MGTTWTSIYKRIGWVLNTLAPKGWIRHTEVTEVLFSTDAIEGSDSGAVASDSGAVASDSDYVIGDKGFVHVAKVMSTCGRGSAE